MSLEFNESILPTSSKFSLQELEWNPNGKSKNGLDEGIFEPYGEELTSDATISEAYSITTDNAKYPVEGGDPLSNSGGMTGHSITISAVNSNTSFSLIENIAGSAAIAQALASSAIGQNFSANTRVQKIYDRLMWWSTYATPLRLKTMYAKNGYIDANGDNAVFQISGFTINRNQNTGDAIGYTLNLDRIFIARVTSATLEDIVRVDNTEIQSDKNEEVLPVNDDPNGGRALKRASNYDVQNKSGGFEAYFEQTSKISKL